MMEFELRNDVRITAVQHLFGKMQPFENAVAWQL
jgi:hypothetical protein